MNKLPTPGLANCVNNYGNGEQYFWPGLLTYYENNEIIFLYPDAKNLAVKYSITQRSHRKIQKSILPMAYRFEVSNTRLGNHIWVMGGQSCNLSGNLGIYAYNVFYTMLWSIKKEKWFFGPKMPQEYSQHIQLGCIKDPVFSLHYRRINN